MCVCVCVCVRSNLHVEVQQDNHLTARRLEEGLLHVAVEKVNLVPLQSGVPQTIGVCFQGAL